MSKYPVIYELDDDGEATGVVYFYCCTGCRSQSRKKQPDAANYGDDCDAIPGTQCEFCGKTLDDSEAA